MHKFLGLRASAFSLKQGFSHGEMVQWLTVLCMSLSTCVRLVVTVYEHSIQWSEGQRQWIIPNVTVKKSKFYYDTREKQLSYVATYLFIAG